MERSLDSLRENIKIIQDRVAEAAFQSGRNYKDITILAATKMVAPQILQSAIDFGIKCVGESRVQELLQKYVYFKEKECQIHFIGHLQRNKVKHLIGKVDMIQSVDRLLLAQEISRLSVIKKAVTEVLIEVNIGKEGSKSGVDVENLEELLYEISELPGIKIRGLMAIPPVCEDKKLKENYFLLMKRLFVDLSAKNIYNNIMDYLSMGMSSDYYEAILHGANMVRVGSAIFGKRNYGV
jgi:pyridoxal phosphate enzyme (YggS family)